MRKGYISQVKESPIFLNQSAKMTENEFEELMSLADYLVLSGDYLIGYQKGLLRHYYDESYGTEIEHYQ
jgi:hypothetical protein